jgi:hypothetical protein
VTGQFREGGAGVLLDIVGDIERVHAVNADQQDMFDFLCFPAIVSTGWSWNGGASQAERQGGRKEFLHLIFSSRLTKQANTHEDVTSPEKILAAVC